MKLCALMAWVWIKNRNHLHYQVMLNSSNTAAMLLLIIGGSVGGSILLSLLITSVRDVIRSRQVEQTKRELAAYVAEGSMSSDDAYKIAAGGEPCKCRRRA